MILEQCTFTGTPISSDPASSQSLLQLGVRLERIWSTGKHFIQDQTAASKETSQEKEMQYLQIVSEQPAPILGDQRRSHRQQVSQLLAVTAKGSGRIIDINSGGISFKCLYPHTFPQEMEIDILGENGILIKGVRVEKNWEEDSYTPGHQTDRFEKITGLKFTGMSHRQSAEIEELIEQLESAAFVSA